MATTILIMQESFNFRVIFAGQSRFLKDKFVDRINREVQKHYNDLGINAKYLPPRMLGGGAGFDLTMWLKTLVLIKSAYRVFKKNIGSIIDRTIDASAPQFELFCSYKIDQDIIYESNESPGSIQKELLYHAWIAKCWLKENYSQYEFQIRTVVHFPSYRYSLTCRLSKHNSSAKDLALLIRFVDQTSLVSSADENVTYGNSKLIKHALSFYNIDSRFIQNKKYYYLKVDKIIHKSLQTRGLKKVKQGEVTTALEIVPRLAKSNI